MKTTILSFLDKLPYIRGLRSELNNYKELSCTPPGHYYNPIVDKGYVKEKENFIWRRKDPSELPDIDLNIAEQLSLAQRFLEYYDTNSLQESSIEGKRYYYKNPYFGFTDAFILTCFMRHFKPKRIIEVGSGFSSAQMLDVRDTFNMQPQLTFIEPYTDRLNTLITSKDKKSIAIYQKIVQDVPMDVFSALGENDILFVDSSHVSKTGSDLNHILFEIIPFLKPGVILHFHDIFYPFEYRKQWVLEHRRNWNEIYMLRSFLSYNTSFSILMFNDFIIREYPSAFENMPLCKLDPGGGFWLRKGR